MEELAKKNIAQAVLCVQKSDLAKWCEKHEVPFFTYRKLFSVNPLVAMHLRWICRRLKISHVHVHDSHAHTYAVLAASLFRNPASIIVHRRVDFPIGENWLSLWKYNHASVQKIICVSHFVKKIITPKLKNPAVAHVIHDGIDLEGKEVKRSSLTSHFSPLKIGNVAAIAPHKDYFTFVKTAERLLENGVDAKFLIIGGDGGEEVAVRNMIAKKGLSDHIEMLGFRADVLELLAGLDLLLFTSKTEGLGSSLLDAMALGVPIVATEAGGVPEIVKHEETGLLAPVGDADELARLVIRILENDELRGQLTKNAQSWVQSFSKNKMSERTLEVYRGDW